MGRVFSAEQIQRGMYPSLDDFAIAKQIFAGSVAAGVELGLFYGGEIYGSVAVGTQTVRSDMDVLILLTSGGGQWRSAALRILKTIDRMTDGRVLVDSPLVEPASFTLSGDHELDQFFIETLIGPDRITVGRDPARYILANGALPRDVLYSYIIQKNRRLRDAYNSPDSDIGYYNGLQRQLELPVAMARKALQALGAAGVYPTEKFSAVNKPAVIELGRKLFSSRELSSEYNLVETFDKLVKMDEYYSFVLDEFIKGRIDIPEYNKSLTEMHAYLPTTIQWIKAVQAAIIPLFESK
ncbi:hypothetical protein FWH58_00190 [Candidatus Saccharibacteria bacterium]|nr:hypothetical protein [Candidatus Saccharibacteria bacterium]